MRKLSRSSFGEVGISLGGSGIGQRIPLRCGGRINRRFEALGIAPEEEKKDIVNENKLIIVSNYPKGA